jgi:nitrogen-specific signal transduction histidine kinase
MNSLYQILKGKYRLKLVLFALISVSLLGFSIIYFIASVNKPYVGAELYLESDRWKIRAIDNGGLAAQIGIKPDDIIVEVNGQTAAEFLEKYSQQGTVASQIIRELVVTDSNGNQKTANVDVDPIPATARITVIIWFLVTIVFWITGFYVFFKRPKYPAAVLLCLCGLITGVTLMSTAAGERLFTFANILSVYSALIGPWLLLHFFLILPEERVSLRENPRVYLLYLPALVTMILFPLIGFVDGQPVGWFRTIRFLIIGLGFLGAVGTMVYNYFKSPSPKTRQQMKIVMITCLVAVIPVLLLNLLPSIIWNYQVIPASFSVLFLIFIPIGLAYAVVTQKLMDIDVIIRRSVVYLFITLIMAAILSAAVFPIIAYQSSVSRPLQIVLMLVMGGIATALFGPIKRWIENMVDKFFYKDRYDYRQIIQTLSTSLNSLQELSDIARLIVGTAVRTLNLAGACLFVKGQANIFDVNAAEGTFTDSKQQNQLLLQIFKRNPRVEFPNSASPISPDVAFFIPLKAGDKEVGFLCLSQKISRQEFSANDIYLLQGLAAVAAVSLRSAMLTHDVSLRDTFVSIASHELRTPLTSIVGYADLLLKRDPPPETRQKWLKNILDNGQRITDMVDDLLNITRIQSGRINLKLEGIKLTDTISERLAIIQEGSTRHEFIIDVPQDISPVLADRDKLGQVIGNLLSNAVKYSPHGGKITISAYNETSKNRIVIAISDQGLGISPADQSTLFKTFHRIQRPETRVIRGSGLGLYIVKEWAEAMGGEVWLESELNKGSTFFVGIPALDSREENKPAPDQVPLA